jgi:hypothetical protein
LQIVKVGKGTENEMDSCCSVLEQDSTQGFVSDLKTTFKNFALGFKRLIRVRNQRGIKSILKGSLSILTTAESVCILTAVGGVAPVLNWSLLPA